VTGDPDFDRLLERCLEVLKVKGHDYTMGSPDRLANFREAGRFLDEDPMKVLGVHLYKHVAAVFSYIKGRTESEPIEERLVDVINYCLLLGRMVAEAKRLAGEDARVPCPSKIQDNLGSELPCAKAEGHAGLHLFLRSIPGEGSGGVGEG